MSGARLDREQMDRIGCLFGRLVHEGKEPAIG